MDQVFRIERTEFTDKSTIGEFYDPQDFKLCFTLEDPIRKSKMIGQTAIPAGKYEILMGFSNRFERIMPRLQRVPFFDGILIHPGNDENDTQGCILVGQTRGKDAVWSSRAAFDELFPILRRAAEKGKVFVHINGGYPASEWV